MSVRRNLAALAVLIATFSISLIPSSDAQAGSRHGSRGYGGHGMYGGSKHMGGSMQVTRIAPVHAMRAHPAIAYTARPYTAASYAPRAYHSYAGGYGSTRVVHYAAPVRQVHQMRYVHYQPTVYHQATYAKVRHVRASRSHCVC
jgi:hypothetical protein